ncbi:HD domain-containing protein [Mesorhizobium sp. VK9D]|uniref:HD domain-containing protein n=1 Tax=Mesorhizobium australafricanum TaxID=3072311 RepID=UPI002A23F316|nr:HD domain-containing protein [Mesorhizobium sp. VK9D]MDX8452835.1 HD domain-containing protein [Mesorhizobium sp. VK9D]
MLHEAAQIAADAHRGQKDKTGRPYIEHLRRVADSVETLDEKTVAYLHDVVEKGEGWSLDRLHGAGFGLVVVAAVDALTRRMDESEEGFLWRAASNELALPVKIADLRDNLWQAHQAGVDPNRYETGLGILGELATRADRSFRSPHAL